jgi:hypothetical protein
LVEYIDAYEAVARDVYREQSRQVAPDADLVVDGRAPVEDNLHLILDSLG